MKAIELKKICEKHVNDLIKAIAETRDEKKFRQYLDFCSRFHRYSFSNRILIWSYQPDATFVAGYKTWHKMGRWVKKGSTGIPIFAPLSFRKKKDPDEATETDKGVNDYLGFKVVYVYDVSQTEGDPIPDLDTLAVDGQTLLLGALEHFTRFQGIKLGYSSDKALEYLHAAGVSVKGRIEIKSSLTESQRFYVLAHELAHEFLHDIQERKTLSTRIKELEADATAYAVSRHFGLETRSSIYLALYRIEEVDVKASLDRIVSTASKIISGVYESDNSVSVDNRKQDAA